MYLAISGSSLPSARFASAAARCVEAGFDAIELHAGHGYLIDSFLSPYANQREDGWGGPLEGRARLLIEVLRATKAAVEVMLAALSQDAAAR